MNRMSLLGQHVYVLNAYEKVTYPSEEDSMSNLEQTTWEVFVRMGVANRIISGRPCVLCLLKMFDFYVSGHIVTRRSVVMSMMRSADDQRDAACVETMETLNNLLDLESQSGPQLCKKSCLKKVVAVGVCAGRSFVGAGAVPSCTQPS